MRRPTRAQRSATISPDRPYRPDAGEFVWIDFNPQRGRQQAGRRPALVLSPRRYNELARLCIICLVTSHAKGHPFEAPLPDGGRVTGVVLADHVKSLSWEARNASFAGEAPARFWPEVRAKLTALLQFG